MRKYVQPFGTVHVVWPVCGILFEKNNYHPDPKTQDPTPAMMQLNGVFLTPAPPICDVVQLQFTLLLSIRLPSSNALRPLSLDFFVPL